eukprot:TRINITY_DN10915_c0_g1_i2.p1 TRINITY_DN10915_c0_g1~~TRINITY_DN10915_c0_g1_i2.p1  ORF type:complete len:459 (-),score=27.53 TRINITY_DN10915_c0_g1_i2:208-1584(-)
MSDGYADRLTQRRNLGGQLGAPENYDDKDTVKAKLEQMVQMVQQAQKIIFFTGAGISTASGIPDFRGPNGVWTLKKQGKQLPENTTPFYAAKPTLTHMAIVGFLKEKKADYIISQNVDCLHLKSGIPRCSLAELHGNVFAERCPKCKTEYIRCFEQETVGKKLTGRSCEQEGCTGRLRDNILDWEDDLPEDEYSSSLAFAKNADLMIVLGSSLQVTPANDIPVETVRSGGQLVIVNLQETPKDKFANLIIRAKADDVMRSLTQSMGLQIPSYLRQERLIVKSQQLKPYQTQQGIKTRTRIYVYGQDGPEYPMPMIKQINMKIDGSDESIQSQYLGKKGCLPIQSEIEALPGGLTVTLQVQFVKEVDEDKRNESVELQLNLHDEVQFDQELTDQSQKAIEAIVELGFIVQYTDYETQSRLVGEKRKPFNSQLDESSMQPKRLHITAGGLIGVSPTNAQA